MEVTNFAQAQNLKLEGSSSQHSLWVINYDSYSITDCMSIVYYCPRVLWKSPAEAIPNLNSRLPTEVMVVLLIEIVQTQYWPKFLDTLGLGQDWSKI